jgi:hypothetical protein
MPATFSPRIHPGAGFDAGDFQSCARQRQHSHTPGRAQPDHGNIDRLQIDRHGVFRQPLTDITRF